MGRNTQGTKFGKKGFKAVCLECAKNGIKSIASDRNFPAVQTKVRSGNTKCGHNEEDLIGDVFMYIDNYKENNEYPDLNDLIPIEETEEYKQKNK